MIRHTRLDHVTGVQLFRSKEAPRMSVSRQVFIIGKNDYTMKKYLKRTKNQTTFA
jgi:hypothetical protein